MNLSQELFQRYAERGDEDAFRELVANYFSLVRSTALRRLQGNSSLADDVVQLVFTDFAKKAPRLPKDLFLGGWLHQHTCFVAAKTIRTEMRRTRREREAVDMKTLGSTEAHILSPVLDEAIHELPNDDRSALILRFIEGRDLKAVGEVLKVSEDAAQKRVQRALERLRTLLTSKGLTTSIAALTVLLTSPDAAGSVATVDRVAETALKTIRSGIDPRGLLKVFRLRIAIPLLMVGVATLVWWRSSLQDEGRADPTVGGLVAPSTDTWLADQSSQSTRVSASAIDQPANDADAGLEPHVLKVHVVDDSTGLPISAALVRHLLSQNEQPTAADPVYLTNDKGVAQVNLPGQGTRRFQISTFHTNYSGWISIWDLNNGEFIPPQHEIRLTPGVRIGGTVLDPTGAPLRDVAVRVNRFWSGGERIDRSNQRLNISTVTNRTGSDGRWSVSHVPEKILERIGLHFVHPDYAETNKSVADDCLPMLRSGTFTVTLTKGMNLFGYVRETNSNPVVSAKVSFGRPNFQNQRETATDENGRYEFKNLFRYGPFNETEPVTVLAEGFAPAVRHIGPQDDTEQLDFVVEPGKTLRGRVLNEAGEPIEGVRVSRENNQFDAPNEAGIEWSTRTDKEGRFQWAGAPATPQSFYFGHESYAQVRGKKLGPSEEEHVIVLQRKRFVQGTVRNHHNGEFLQEFYVLPASGTPERISSWSVNDERAFKDGVFQLQLGEEKHNMVRIRAEGYYMVNFRIPRDGAELHANLKPSTALSGVVYDLEGQPVPGVEVAVIGSAGQKSVAIAKGKFSRSQRDVDRTETDANGHFVIQPSVEVETLVAVSAKGYAEIRLEPKRDYAMTLQPWGRVEGVALQGVQPLAGATLTLSMPRLETRNLHLDYSSYKCETGPQGEFAFDMVPPRTVQLARQVPMTPRSWTSANQTNVPVHPGQTSRLELKIESAAVAP